MLNISEILERVLIEESVSPDKVNNAIDDKNKIIINYNSHGEDIATGWRIIEPCAYGLTKTGNPVLRAYQPYGDTDSKVPSWKFFRLDRVINWKPTQQHFTEAPPDYNPNGDKSMSVVYNNAKFNDDVSDTKAPEMASPKKKEEPLFIPPGEKEKREKLNNLEKQVDNPIFGDYLIDKPQTDKISDINNKKTQDGFKGSDTENNVNPQQSTGPKKKEEPLFIPPGEKEKRGKLNNLQRQVDNPIFGNYFTNNSNQSTDTKNKIEQPLTKNDGNDIFKTDAERIAKQKLNNLGKQVDKPQYVNPSVMKDYEKNKNKRNNKNI